MRVVRKPQSRAFTVVRFNPALSSCRQDRHSAVAGSGSYPPTEKRLGANLGAPMGLPSIAALAAILAPVSRGKPWKGGQGFPPGRLHGNVTIWRFLYRGHRLVTPMAPKSGH